MSRTAFSKPSRLVFIAALVVVGLAYGCAAPTGEEDENEVVAEDESELVAGGKCARKYADDRGWPIGPVHTQHPVRGAFQEPRTEGYHNGIDISVDDQDADLGAPPGRTHKVFALEGGEVWNVISPASQDCGVDLPIAKVVKAKPGCEGAVHVGHFGYGHVLPVVKKGDVIQAGQLVGWTTVGEWHLHLSEWCFPDGNREHKVAVNPLARKGKIAPFVDTAAPVIHDIAFHKPASPPWQKVHGFCALFPEGGAEIKGAEPTLSGIVDVRAHIDDPQSFRGWLKKQPELVNDHHPARVHLVITAKATNKVILDRDVFTTSMTMGKQLELLGAKPMDPSNHFAPGTSESLRGAQAIHSKTPENVLWFRLFGSATSQYWDTRDVQNGKYGIAVTAYDLVGNRATKNTVVTITN